MDVSSENQVTHEQLADRQGWSIRKGRLGDASLERGSPMTPEQRLALVWPLTIQAWAFRGVDVAESRLPRHLMSVTRRQRHCDVHGLEQNAASE